MGYDIDVVTYISAGFDILIINYRGSTGFGQGMNQWKFNKY